MNFNTLLGYFEEAQGFKHIQEVICILCGASLEIRSLDGRIFKCNFSPSLSKKSYESKADFHVDCQHRSEACKCLVSNIIEKATISGQTQINKCQAGLTQILLPIHIRKEIVGYLIVLENQFFRLSYVQIKAIINLLENFIKDIQAELDLFPNLKKDNLSYQQMIVHKVVQYISEHYHQPELTLKQVSEANGISYHYLSRLIKKVLKTTFSQYLNQTRLEVASRLLQNRSLSVSEIAYTCGYEDPGYFCKLFKRMYGKSPGIFRLNPPNRISSPKVKQRLFPARS